MEKFPEDIGRKKNIYIFKLPDFKVHSKAIVLKMLSEELLFRRNCL